MISLRLLIIKLINQIYTMINKKMYISTRSKLSHKFFIFAATADTEPFLLSLPPRK